MNMKDATDNDPQPSLRQATQSWAKIGLLSFGGPAAQIALMHKVVVEEKGWLKEQQFLNALNFCMLLPGPEAMQLATYAGWRLHGVMGGLIAGLLFVVPGALIILLLAIGYSTFGQVDFVQSLFFGIKAAVIVIVLEALIKVSKRTLNSAAHYIIALLAFLGLFVFSIPFPLIIGVAALYGYLASTKQLDEPDSDSVGAPVAFSKTVQTIALWLLIWMLPVIGLWLLGANQILIELALFFSKLAVVTFGGAYAVLAYIAQDVVQTNNWLTVAEMVDGLGLAETTPGPLILVTEFVGFLSAEKAGGIALGIAGAAVTLWVTFVPCFLWIFAGAPYLEWISAQPRLRGALSAITAAVVGVILNLSIWFAIHVFFSSTQKIEFGFFALLLPELGTVDWRVLVLALASGILLLIMKWNLLAVLTLSALGGVLLSLL